MDRATGSTRQDEGTGSFPLSDLSLSLFLSIEYQSNHQKTETLKCYSFVLDLDDLIGLTCCGQKALAAKVNSLSGTVRDIDQQT